MTCQAVYSNIQTLSWELTKKHATASVLDHDVLIVHSYWCLKYFSRSWLRDRSKLGRRQKGCPPIHCWYPSLLTSPGAYLSRLESEWEEEPCPLLLALPPVPNDPLPVPADCRFPDKSFSTAARFPVRAASRSSCSFPIADSQKKPEKARGREENGGLITRVKFLCDSPLFPTQPQVISQYRWSCGEETKAPSAAGTVRPDPRCRWRWRKSFIR